MTSPILSQPLSIFASITFPPLLQPGPRLLCCSASNFLKPGVLNLDFLTFSLVQEKKLDEEEMEVTQMRIRLEFSFFLQNGIWDF
ncbi:unnamed protein product [Prunus brigantina]